MSNQDDVNMDVDETDDYFCGVCNIQCDSLDAYERHARGMIHTQKLMAGGEPREEKPSGQPDGSERCAPEPNQQGAPPRPAQQGPPRAPPQGQPREPSQGQPRAPPQGQPREPPQVQPHSEPQPPPSPSNSSTPISYDSIADDVALSINREFYCMVCEAQMSGQKTFNEHIAGTRHHKNLRNRERGLPISKSKIKKVALAQTTSEPPRINYEVDQYESALLGLQYVVEHQVDGMEDENYYTCELCMSTCSPTIILKHVAGMKHRMKYLEVHYNSYYMELYSASRKRSETNALLADYALAIENDEGRKQIRVAHDQVGIRRMSQKRAMQFTSNQAGGKMPNFGDDDLGGNDDQDGMYDEGFNQSFQRQNNNGFPNRGNGFGRGMVARGRGRSGSQGFREQYNTPNQGNPNSSASNYPPRNDDYSLGGYPAREPIRDRPRSDPYGHRASPVPPSPYPAADPYPSRSSYSREASYPSRPIASDPYPPRAELYPSRTSLDYPPRSVSRDPYPRSTTEHYILPKKTFDYGHGAVDTNKVTEDKPSEQPSEKKEEKLDTDLQEKVAAALKLVKPLQGPEKKTTSDLLKELMSDLPSFEISSEEEAAMVLHVSNCLTQILLDYRLKSVSPIIAAVNAAGNQTEDINARLRNPSPLRDSLSLVQEYSTM